MSGIRWTVEKFVRLVNTGHTPSEDVLKDVAAYLKDNMPNHSSDGRPKETLLGKLMLTETFVWLREVFKREEALEILGGIYYLTNSAIEKKLLPQSEQEKFAQKPQVLEFAEYVRLVQDTDPAAYAKLRREMETLTFEWEQRSGDGKITRNRTQLFAKPGAFMIMSKAPEKTDE